MQLVNESTVSQGDTAVLLLMQGKTISGLSFLDQAQSMKLSTRLGEAERRYGFKAHKRMVTTPSHKIIAEYTLSLQARKELFKKLPASLVSKLPKGTVDLLTEKPIQESLFTL